MDHPGVDFYKSNEFFFFFFFFFLGGQSDIQDGPLAVDIVKMEDPVEKCIKDVPPLKLLDQFKANTVRMVLWWS